MAAGLAREQVRTQTGDYARNGHILAAVSERQGGPELIWYRYTCYRQAYSQARLPLGFVQDILNEALPSELLVLLPPAPRLGHSTTWHCTRRQQAWAQGV